MTNETLWQLNIFGEHRIVTKRAPKPRRTVARVLHLGAGVQSSALVEMAVEGELEPFDYVLFADTGDEPDWVYAQVRYLKRRLAKVGMPLSIVKRTGAGIMEDGKVAGRFVSMPLFTRNNDGTVGQMKRQCTSEYKIIPCDNYQLNWLLEQNFAKYDKAGHRRVDRKIQVENIYGISFDEYWRGGKRGPGWQKAVYPLIDRRMTRADCTAWLKAHGLPIPLKSACIECPYHDDDYWLWLSVNHPPTFGVACNYDDWLRTPEARNTRLKTLKGEAYLHRSCIPLRLIDFTKPIDAPLFASVCGDHCLT